MVKRELVGFPKTRLLKRRSNSVWINLLRFIRKTAKELK